VSGLQIVALDDSVDRNAFDCGNESLTRYFRQQATQDIRRRVAFCYVATDDAGLIGYYTLASASVRLADLPDAQKKKLPGYGDVPCVLLGRLAIGVDRQGKGYGGDLLVDAIERALKADLASHAMLADPIDARAEAFYAHHGFIHAIESMPNRMFFNLVTAAKAAQKAAQP
jgi:GNAT superfamily N-acetyltransferase